jgi:hypothetical protein
MEETVAMRSGTIVHPDSIEIAADASKIPRRLFETKLAHFLNDPKKYSQRRCAALTIFILMCPLCFL